MWHVVWLAFAAACAVFSVSAQAADLPSPPVIAPAPAPASGPTFPADDPAATSGGSPGNQWEARIGGFYHGAGSVEHNTADVNGSVLTPRLQLGIPGYWANFLPRLQLGGAVNLAGRTSFAYLDIALDLPIASGVFIEPFLGGAVHNGSLTATPLLSGLGCPILFHAGGSIGYVIGQHWTVAGTFEHLSNGKSLFGVDCGTNQTLTGSNQGLNNYGISVGYRF